MSKTNSPLFFNSKILYLPVSHNRFQFRFDFSFFLICNAINKCYFFCNANICVTQKTEYSVLTYLHGLSPVYRSALKW